MLVNKGTCHVEDSAQSGRHSWLPHHPLPKCADQPMLRQSEILGGTSFASLWSRRGNLLEPCPNSNDQQTMQYSLMTQHNISAQVFWQHHIHDTLLHSQSPSSPVSGGWCPLCTWCQRDMAALNGFGCWMLLEAAHLSGDSKLDSRRRGPAGQWRRTSCHRA